MQNEIEQANPWVGEWPTHRRPPRLVTKCYGPTARCERPYKGDSDV